MNAIIVCAWVKVSIFDPLCWRVTRGIVRKSKGVNKVQVNRVSDRVKGSGWGGQHVENEHCPPKHGNC